MRSAFVLLLLCAIIAAGCLGPGGGPVPTPTPTTGGTFSTAQLKYILLDHYNESRFFFCDPDYHPVARGDETAKAVATFPDIQEDTGTFGAIVARKGLQPPYTNETKLVIYREWKKLQAIPLAPTGGNAYSFSLQLGTTGQGLRVTGTIRGDGTILSEQSETTFLTCPICLAAGTLIDTPAGQVKVEDIRIGAMVWTADADGSRVAAPVIQTGKTPVPASHRLVHLRLSDGRELFASPGHPLADGRQVGALSPGDDIDRAMVTDTTLVPSVGFTYDILPAGDTGTYWANRIPLKSTLVSPVGRGPENW